MLAGKKISGKDGVLAPLVKQLVEAALSWNPKRLNQVKYATAKLKLDSFDLDDIYAYHYL